MAGEAAMRFFLDETSFELSTCFDPEVLEQCLDALVQLIQARRAERTDVFRWSKLLEEVEVVPGTLLCDLVYQTLSHIPLDRDVKKALMEVLNRCVDWDDRVESIPDPTVEMNGGTCIAQTLALVHSMNAGGSGACCLALGMRPDRSGIRPVIVDGTEVEIHFVTREEQIPLFYRTLFELEDLGEDAYMENAHRAFPKLVFAPALAAQFSRFETPYAEARPLVTRHLAVLNDHFQSVHQKWKDKTDEAIGAHGIDASLERGKTHKNKSAMAQRTVVIDGISVLCEWHTKLKRHTDRIHFHTGHPGFGGRLVVGLFKDHFDT